MHEPLPCVNHPIPSQEDNNHLAPSCNVQLVRLPVPLTAYDIFSALASPIPTPFPLRGDSFKPYFDRFWSPFGGPPIMPASTNLMLVPENSAAIRLTVSGLTALQSTNVCGEGNALPYFAATSCIFSANDTASLGGKILRIQSDLSTSSSTERSIIPASCARFRVSSERPSRLV